MCVLGMLVRYADDFVVMCDTKAAVEEARERVCTVRRVSGWSSSGENEDGRPLAGREGFDFLGCHLRSAERPSVGTDPAAGLLFFSGGRLDAR